MFGMRFFFYSREHEPIHVHVKGADGKAKFDILPEGIVLVKNEGLKPKDIKAAEIRNLRLRNGMNILEGA